MRMRSFVRTRRVLIALAALASALGAACSDATDPGPGERVVAIDLERIPDTLGVGDSLVLAARPLGLADRPLDAAVSWTSRAPGVLEVSPSGTARARSAGDAWVVVRARGASGATRVDSVRVRVEPSSRSLRLVVPGDTIAPDVTFTVRLDVDSSLGARVPDSTARFTSSDPQVLVVDSITGAARFLTDADASITVTAGGRTARVALHSWLQRVETNGASIRKLAMGWGFACGLDAGGLAYCWGQNNRGQLGRGTRLTGSARLPFAPVIGSNRYVDLSAGRGGACAVTTGGGVDCWGAMQYPFVRDALEYPLLHSLPLPANARPFKRVFSGARAATCAIDDAGRTFCWGDNPYGGLPFDSTAVFPMRQLPDTVGAMTSMASGEMHGCVTTVDGALWCWGFHSLVGETGPVSRSALVRVSGIPPMASVAAAFQSTCALDRTGGTWCGGYLVDPVTGTEDFRRIARVEGVPAFTQLDVEANMVCGLAASGEAWCWRTEYLIAGVAYPTVSPTRFSQRHRFVEIAAGSHGACGVTTDGALVCRESATSFQ